MSKSENQIGGTLSLCAAGAVHYSDTRSTATVIRVLGVRVGEDGHAESIYLDRLIHSRRKAEIGPWGVNGAVSSVLYPKAAERAQTPRYSGPRCGELLLWQEFAAGAGLSAEQPA